MAKHFFLIQLQAYIFFITLPDLSKLIKIQFIKTYINKKPASQQVLAGIERFELPNGWFRASCLTTWLYPNALYYYTRFKQRIKRFLKLSAAGRYIILKTDHQSCLFEHYILFYNKTNQRYIYGVPVRCIQYSRVKLPTR